MQGNGIYDCIAGWADVGDISPPGPDALQKGKSPGRYALRKGLGPYPGGAQKPQDGRRRKIPPKAKLQAGIFEKEKPDVFQQLIEQFPYAIQVFSARRNAAVCE